MNIYDVNGNGVREWFDIEGNEKDTYFDVEGNEYNKQPPVAVGDLVVMSFNVLRWTETLRSGALLRKIMNAITTEFDGHSPDVLGIQEHKSATVTTTSGNPEIAVEELLANEYGLEHLELSEEYSTVTHIILATASKYELTDVEDVKYLNNALDRYQKSYITVGGKRIAIINTHLNYTSDDFTEYRYAQARMLCEAVANEEYFIIMGDLNTFYCDSTESDTYVDMLKQFADAGYHLANCSDENGFHYTHNSGGTIGEGGADGRWNYLDHIITSGNITIDKVYVDETKLTSKVDWYIIDHLPIAAHLTVYDYQ